MLEKQIEQKLCQAVHRRGGYCWKLTSPGHAGVPDRIILLPGRKIGFIELKKPGTKPRPLQTYRHQQLQALGIQVHIIDHPAQIKETLNAIQTA